MGLSPTAVTATSLSASNWPRERESALLPHLPPFSLSLPSMTRVLKCAGNDDSITLRSQDNTDTLTVLFESPSESHDL